MLVGMKTLCTVSMAVLAASPILLAEEVSVSDVQSVSNTEAVAYDNATVRRIVQQTIAEMQQQHASQASYSLGGGEKGGETCCVCDCCPCCCDTSGWFAGAEATFLRPHFDSFANGSQQTFNQQRIDNVQPSIDVFESPQYNYHVSPRVWLGYVGPQCIGIRARYWNFDHDSETLIRPTEVFTGRTQDESLSTSLEMETLDLELTYQRDVCNWRWTGSAGVRYAKVERGQIFTRDEVFTSSSGSFGVGDTRKDRDFTAQEFEGIGPTISLEGRAQTGIWGFSAFANLRGSLLVGENDETIFSRDVDDRLGTITVREEIDIDRTEGIFPVGEMQVGVEWGRDTCYGRLSIRGAFEAQYWVDTADMLRQDDDDSRDVGLVGFTLGGEWLY